MLNLQVKADTKGITASLKQFVANHQKAVVRALNKTALQARTEAVRDVRGAGYNIRAGDIRKSFKIKRANGNRLVVELVSTGAPIAVIAYGARQTKSGVSIQVKNGRQILRHAFIATTKSGHRGVFERVGPARVKGAKGKVRGRVRRLNLPIKELFGPSIPQSLANEAVNKAIMKKIAEVYPRLLQHEIAFEIQKSGGGK
jgi:Prophage minor tail protein Z (GPZ)